MRDRQRRARARRVSVRAHRLPADAPSPGVPGTEVVPHVDDDVALRRVRTAGKRALEVDDAQPEALACTSGAGCAHRATIRNSGDTGSISPFDAHRQVDAEDEAPELTLGRGCRRERLDERDLALRKAVLPLRLDAVDRIRSRLAVELDERQVLRAWPRAATPPDPRGGSSHHSASRGEKPGVAERTRSYTCSTAAPPPRARCIRTVPARTWIVAEREAGPIGVHLVVRRGHPVAEAAVDRSLRRPQNSPAARRARANRRARAASAV